MNGNYIVEAERGSATATPNMASNAGRVLYYKLPNTQFIILNNRTYIYVQYVSLVDHSSFILTTDVRDLAKLLDCSCYWQSLFCTN